jgi:transposase InsO family protein
MPWSETTAMTERLRFIADLESSLYTMTELCARHDISRPTGYKWSARWVADGVDGLKDRSRAPLHCPHRTEAPVVEALLAARRQHPRWGPRKLLAYLSRRHPEWDLPAASTAGAILKRHGLVEPRRRRRRLPHRNRSQPEVKSANDLWTCDFKGEFRTGDGRYCYPLTVADQYSRYLLGCEGRTSTASVGARSVFEDLFRKNGLPKAIKSDNGSPFSSPALCGLSRLSVWWIKLGIEPVLIARGHPEQNGSHERMHRTLKAETTRPPASDMGSQQRRFDGFREEFNEERPHEALGQQPPAELYHPSPRRYPDVVPKVEYPGHYEVRSVRHDGLIKWQGDFLFVSGVLAGEPVGLEEIDDGIWSLYFGPLFLARFDERESRLEGATSGVHWLRESGTEE